MNSFTRGKDPKETLDIGLDYRNRIPELGRSFLVHFRIRESSPELYSLQDRERNGIPIIATCTREFKGNIYNPYAFNIILKRVMCEVEGIEYWANMDDKGEWEISTE